jgi:hypothetical protein
MSRRDVTGAPQAEDVVRGWHQRDDVEQTEGRIGTSRSRASANASSFHSRQSTGLSACWRS